MADSNEKKATYEEFRLSLVTATAEYRQQFKSDPAKVLREYGLEVSADIKFQVVENTAALKHLVLPEANSATGVTKGVVAWSEFHGCYVPVETKK